MHLFVLSPVSLFFLYQHWVGPRRSWGVCVFLSRVHLFVLSPVSVFFVPTLGGAPQGGGPAGWAPEGGGRQKFCAIFPSPATIFILSSFSWGSSRGILVVFEAPGPEMFTFGVLGLSCEAPAATARESKRGHLRSPVFKNTTKIQREYPKRRKKE